MTMGENVWCNILVGLGLVTNSFGVGFGTILQSNNDNGTGIHAPKSQTVGPWIPVWKSNKEATEINTMIRSVDR